MKLIRFSNGTFGVRYGFFSYRYQDFKNTEMTWGKGSRFFMDCQTEEGTARKFITGSGRFLTDKIIPI